MLMRKLVPHFIPCLFGHYTTNVFMKIVIYKSGNQHINKLTNNDLNKLRIYTDHFVVTFLNPTYYADISLMLPTTYYAQNYAGIIGLGLELGNIFLLKSHPITSLYLMLLMLTKFAYL